ncbi:MAG: DUF4345 domain-containing protein [Devosia sp.]
MNPTARPNYVLRAAIAIVGAFVVFLGLNVGLGGIQTLGWQGGAAPFLDITDASMFAVRDNHIRFIGGVWLSLGLLMLAGSIAFQQMRSVLIPLTAMMFVGGVVRFASGDFATLFSVSLVPSLIFEIVVAPLLGLWIWKAERAD